MFFPVEVPLTIKGGFGWVIFSCQPTLVAGDVVQALSTTCTVCGVEIGWDFAWLHIVVVDKRWLVQLPLQRT